MRYGAETLVFGSKLQECRPTALGARSTRLSVSLRQSLIVPLSLIPTPDSARNNPNIPQMPLIVSHIADTTDVTALEAWISALPNPSDAGGD